MLFLIVSNSFAGEPTVGAVVRPEAWWDPVREDTDGNGSPDIAENTYELHTWARGWIAGETKKQNRWFAEVRLQHHATVGVTGVDTMVPEGWWELGVGESGWDGKLGGPFRLRVGALTERWGKLDLLPVADILNPRDVRSGASTNADFSRVPVPMAVLAVEGRSVRAETVYIPFASSDRLFTRETDWSYMRQGYTDELLGQMIVWASTTPDGAPEPGTFSDVAVSSLLNTRGEFATMDPHTRRMQDMAMLTQSLPEAFGDGDIAERLEWSGRNVDLALFGGYLRSRQPELVLDPILRQYITDGDLPVADIGDITALSEATAGGPLLNGWPRTVAAGLDASALAGPLQFRAEGLYRTAQVVRLTYGDATTVPSIGAGVGVDWFQSSKFQLSLEGRYTHLEDAPANLLFALPDQVQVAGGVRWLGESDRLTVQVGGVYDVSFGEGLARPSVSWKFSDHVLADVTGLILAGRTPAPTGVFDSFTYEGGLLSYFQTNDSVALALQFTP